MKPSAERAASEVVRSTATGPSRTLSTWGGTSDADDLGGDRYGARVGRMWRHPDASCGEGRDGVPQQRGLLAGGAVHRPRPGPPRLGLLPRTADRRPGRSPRLRLRPGLSVRPTVLPGAAQRRGLGSRLLRASRLQQRCAVRRGTPVRRGRALRAPGVRRGRRVPAVVRVRGRALCAAFVHGRRELLGRVLSARELSQCPGPLRDATAAAAVAGAIVWLVG